MTSKSLLASTFALVLMTACSGPSPVSESPSAEGPVVARNVILFIGDGMGVATVTAARIFAGQSLGLSGEEHSLAFESFPHVALVKTYNTNQQVPDSAGTITAMLTGTKTRAGVINVSPDVLRGACASSLTGHLTPISALARRKGKAIGVVTTTGLTHATPAAVYAHSPERDWEDDSGMPADASQQGCRDIAWQLVNDENVAPDVALGGGAEQFFGPGRSGARRKADDDLVRDWLSGGVNRRYVATDTQLDGLRSGEQVLGLFAPSHMTYMAERPSESVEPTLTKMATTAVRLLEANEEGYFLLIEGGRIDHGHHDGRPGYALVETQELANAVAAVLDMVDLDETLVLVTADHSHVFTFGGYATRGNPILGLVVKNDSSGQARTEPDLAEDGQPYTALSYANGPGAVRELPRPMPETGVDMLAQSLVPVVGLNSDGSTDHDETHGGEDVALYATGVGADRVGGVIEQDRIFDIMMSAYGWGDDSATQ